MLVHKKVPAMGTTHMCMILINTLGISQVFYFEFNPLSKVSDYATVIHLEIFEGSR